MMISRQPVQDENAKESGECREQDRQLEHDWEKRWNRKEVHRLPVNDEGIKKRRGNVFQRYGCKESSQAATENDVAKRRSAYSHCFVHSVDWKRRMAIPELEPFIPHFLRGVV